MRRLILGTAGHIDHGKTALVRALTGIDTDRLPEEKRRGITIELGFAALSLDGVDFGIVDVPGHEALVRTMLAGATGMDLVMLVIAADEGVMPQTREHLAIMELLEVRAAVVALTKADLVDAEWLELVTVDVAEALAGTRFHDAPIIGVSAKTGAGLDSLRSELSRMAAAIDARTAEDLFRLPVDRVFTRHGTGTVVTGTVWSGAVPRDAALTIWPAGTPARARGLQVHGSARESAAAGERVAIALAVDRDAVRRGDVLTAHAGWQPSMLITAWLTVLQESPRPVRNRQRIRFHLGTAEVLGRVALLADDVLEPGASGWVQLRLEAPCIARAGDRFVIRSYSPVSTIGGGAIAEPSPARRKRLSSDRESVLRSILDDSDMDAITTLITAAAADGVAATDLPVLTGRAPTDIEAALLRIQPLRIGDSLFDAALGETATHWILESVAAHHAAAPLDPGLPREALRSIASRVGVQVTSWAVDRLIRGGALTSTDGALAQSGFVPSLDTAQHATADALLEAIAEAGLEAPTTADLGGQAMLPVLRFLAGTGQIAPMPGERWVETTALTALIQRLDSGFRPGEDVTTAGLKDAIGVSRKCLIPILEQLDQSGITRRTGENRVWVGTGHQP